MNRKSQNQSDVLWDAWNQFARYDINAVNRARSAANIVRWKEMAVIVSVLLSILTLTLSDVSSTLSILLSLSSVIVGVLVAQRVDTSVGESKSISNEYTKTTQDINAEQLNQYPEWRLIRIAAEMTLREIYFFRTKTGSYYEEKKTSVREKNLAANLNHISDKLLKTDASKTAFVPYNGVIPFPYLNEDNGLANLTWKEYVQFRVHNRILFDERLIHMWEKERRNTKLIVYLFSSLGAVFAFIELLKPWVALTSSYVNTLTSWSKKRNLNKTIPELNIEINELRQVLTWWNSLNSMERNRRKSFQELVIKTENILLKEEDIKALLNAA